MATWSNLALLEHVNLNINLDHTSLAAVRELYCGALGMREDPRPAARGRGASLLWANCGLSQVHLPCDAEAGASAAASQRVDGCIGVLVARGALAGGAGAALPSGPAPPALLALRARATPCLYLPASPATLGNAYLLEEADAADAQHEAAMAAAGAAPHPCLQQPAPPLPAARALGLTMLQLRLPAAALPHVAAFFSAVLGARVEQRSGAVLVACDGVAVASHGRQALLFTAAEAEEGGGAPLLPYDGWHAALYLRDFRGAWEAARAAGLLYDNPRFSDRCGTWEQAVEHAQFRTRLLGEASGAACELELRSLAHPHCPLPRAPPPPPPRRVLSIQSHVVWGRVGNCAAALPLASLGWEVSPLNTVHLATHTGYGGPPVGTRSSAEEVGAVLGGLRQHGLLRGYSALLTGYTPSAALLGVYTALAAEVAGARAGAGEAPLLYVCDPVLGDEDAPGVAAPAAAAAGPSSFAGGAGASAGPTGRLYVPAELVPRFAAHITASRPTILTPNAFEAAQLTGRASSIASVPEALEALEALHALGARCVVMTSTWIQPRGAEGAFLLLASAPWEDVAGEGQGAAGEAAAVALEAGAARRPRALFSRPAAGASQHCRFALCIPRLPLAFTGTGDLTAALLLANYAAHPGCFVSAVERSVAGVRSACLRTAAALAAAPPGVGASRGARAAAAELRVVEARDDFRSPVLPEGMQAYAL